MRGQTFRSLLGGVSSLCTAAQIAEVHARLPAELRTALDRDLASTAWYSLDWYRAIHRVVREVTGAGPELAKRLGREARQLDARGNYHFVLRYSSPEAIIRSVDKIAALYTEGVTFKFDPVEEEKGVRRAAFNYSANGFDENLWSEVLGSMELLMESTGATEVHAICVDGGKEDWLRGSVSWVPAAVCPAEARKTRR